MSGRVTQVLHPGSLAETFAYDADSRVVRRQVGTVLNDTLLYDRRGKVTKAVMRQHNRESEQWYSSLGYVVASKWKSITGTDYAVDEYRYDTHGNATWSRRRDAIETGPERAHAYDGSVRLSEVWYSTSGNPPPGTNTYRDYGTTTGDVTYTSMTHHEQGGAMEGLDQMRYYYGPDGRLRKVQRYGRRWDPATMVPTGYDDLREEYVYDALGRRIVTHTLHEPFCDTRCGATIERTIWDGAQVLVELRAAGDGDLNAQWGTSREHGRVSYLHGPGIDQPLALYRRDFLTSGTIRVRPRTDWRGQYQGGVFSGGWPECTGTNGPNCVFTDWPSVKMHTYLDGQPRPLADWMGSLIQDQRDQSGLLFRRNRYYDPATGQFMQHDPIGIAGGFNLYGFANGDPVNFSDPFGLCPMCLFEIGASLFDAVDLAITGVRFLGGSASREELGVTALGAAAGIIGFGGGTGRAARRALSRAPSTEMGKAVESLKGFLDDGSGAWQLTSSHAEAATGRAYRGGTSIEEVFLDPDTGQRLIRHTIWKGDEMLHETFRQVAKFGGN